MNSNKKKDKKPLQNNRLEAILSATDLLNLDLNTMSEIQFRSTIINLLVALEKSIKDFRNSLTAELRSNQAKIKNTFTEMQSKLDALTARVMEMEERVSDTEEKLLETEEKGEK